VNPFEIMAEPIRRRIVETLSSGAHTTGDIQALIMHEFGVSKAAVHHHLAYLRRVEWVIVREDWPHHWNVLDDTVIPGLESAVRRLRRRWNRRSGWAGGVDPLAMLEGRGQRASVGEAQTKRPRASAGEAQTKRPRSRKGRRGRGMDPNDPWWVGD
jgi:hypothetical protein